MDKLKSWREEKRSAYLYHVMHDHESHPLRRKLFKNLAQAAEDQAAIWQKKLAKGGIKVPEKFSPDLRTRLVGWLLMLFGPERLRNILSSMKVRGMSVFNTNNHERLHRGLTTASNLRAAVFGINDGLISNMSLLLGIAAANANHSTIILAGVAGMLAGACSMGAGEYVSVRSQRELFEYQIDLERKELAEYPEEEMQELAMIYEARGVPHQQALKLSSILINNPETALDTLAREELGLNPNELGSPVGAMFSSFFSFAIGAGIPLIPFLFGEHAWNLSLSIALTALSLIIVGATLSLFTNTRPIISALRMLFIGVAAGALTYFIGHLLGVALY